MPQTPLVDKMFNLHVDSGKKFKRSGQLLFDSEERAINTAIQNSVLDQQQPNILIQPSQPYRSDEDEPLPEIVLNKPPKRGV